MEFSASPDKSTLTPVKCVCGGEGDLAYIPIWDAPGDCAPIIDHYEYMVYCKRCHIGTLKYNNPEVAVKCWNSFMGSIRRKNF